MELFNHKDHPRVTDCRTIFDDDRTLMNASLRTLPKFDENPRYPVRKLRLSVKHLGFHLCLSKYCECKIERILIERESAESQE